MGKAPAFQFYVRDWLSDPQLRMCSHATKGIWIDLLCLMWEAPERGKIEGTVDQIAHMVASSNGDFDQFLQEALSTKFADVTLCNKNVTLINRRMLREEKQRKNTRLRVSRFRSNAACNAPVTIPSSYSSSSSCTKVHNKAQKRPSVLLPDWIEKDLWQDFKEHRNKLRKPMTSRAEETVIKKLTWLKDKGHNPRHCLLTAIERGWLSVFEPKE